MVSRLIEMTSFAGRPYPNGACAVVGSLVGSAMRRAVFRVFVPPGAADEEVIAEKTDEPVAIEAARIWQADVVKKAIDLNRQERYWEAKDFTRQQLRYFRRFCRRFAGGEALCASLERTLRRIARPMREYARKEIGTAMYKSTRGAEDYRSDPPRAWEDYLDEE